ncbi:hypothetical protein INR49_010574 [Caranx melampygus]|nr:hypothetical protein INR49_010574 [Caranx melampygus]
MTTTESESADFSMSKSLSALPAETPSPSVSSEMYQTLSSTPSESPSASPSPSVSTFMSLSESTPSQSVFEPQSPSQPLFFSFSSSPSPSTNAPSLTSQTPSLSPSPASPSSQSPSQMVGSGDPSSTPLLENQDSSTNPTTSLHWVPVEKADGNSSLDYPSLLSGPSDEEEPAWSHAVGSGALLPGNMEEESSRGSNITTMTLGPTNVDDCQSEPCENGGTCIDKIDSFLCLCLPSYGGDTCEKDIEGCEHGWRKFHGHCYRYFTHRHTWEDAEKDCREHSAHLSSVISATEQDFINGLGHDNAWIGLNDRTVYENWRESQPDNFFAGGEDCVVTIAHEDGKWNDVPCNYNLPYICKKGTVLCGTPPTVENAHLIGRRRSHYDIHSVVRYQCSEGFYQRHIPTARCRADGSWERPRIICTKLLQHPGDHTDTDATITISTTSAAATGDTEERDTRPERTHTATTEPNNTTSAMPRFHEVSRADVAAQGQQSRCSSKQYIESDNSPPFVCWDSVCEGSAGVQRCTDMTPLGLDRMGRMRRRTRRTDPRTTIPIPRIGRGLRMNMMETAESPPRLFKATSYNYSATSLTN